MTTDPIVTLAHLRELGYCSRGMRAWFEKHNLNWPDFLANGIPASTLDKIDDSMAADAAAKARGTYGR